MRTNTVRTGAIFTVDHGIKRYFELLGAEIRIVRPKGATDEEFEDMLEHAGQAMAAAFSAGTPTDAKATAELLRRSILSSEAEGKIVAAHKG